MSPGLLVLSDINVYAVKFEGNRSEVTDLIARKQEQILSFKGRPNFDRSHVP